MKKSRDVALIAIFTAFVAVGAFIRIPIPVVPFTLQFLFTMLAGILLGGRRGSISVVSYVLLGLIGLPIFADGGGAFYVLHPTFGYLIGFCLGTYVTGKMVWKTKEPSAKRLLVACFSGLAIVYACGMIYYWAICTFYIGTGIGIWTLFLYCFLLAVPGDILLCFLATY